MDRGRGNYGGACCSVRVWREQLAGGGKVGRFIFLQKDRILCGPLHQNAKNSAVKFLKVVNATSPFLGLVGKRGRGKRPEMALERYKEGGISFYLFSGPTPPTD